MAKIQTLRTSLLGAIIISTISLLLLLSNIENCGHPLCYFPSIWSSSSSATRSSTQSPVVKNGGFKTVPVEYLNTTNDSIQDSTTALEHNGHLKAHTIMVTEQIQTMTKSPVEIELIEDHSATSSPVGNEQVKSMMPKSVPTTVTAVSVKMLESGVVMETDSVELLSLVKDSTSKLAAETVTTYMTPVNISNEQKSEEAESLSTETWRTNRSVDLLYEESTTNSIQKIDLLTESETEHPPVNNVLVENNILNSIQTTANQGVEEIEHVLVDSFNTPDVDRGVATTSSPAELLKDSNMESIVPLTDTDAYSKDLLDASTSNSIDRPTSAPIETQSPSSLNNSPTTKMTLVKEFNPPSKVGSTVSTINPLEEGATYSMFNSGPSFDPFFTDFLPRSAYFDSRPRDGHDNATVILVQVLKTVFEEKRVIKCGVDDRFTSDFLFKPFGIHTVYVHKRYPYLTHDQAMLTCYDLPVQQGSRVFVLYKHKNGTILKIETERRLYIPSERSMAPTNNGGKSSFQVCTTVYGKPPWLREWLVYQKTIGVDFIHIYAQESFITEGSVNNPVLQSYLKSGYAKLDVWKAYLTTKQDYYYQQPLLYVDCIYRYRTEFDYVLLYDTDDFFVPGIPGEKDIHYYADRFFGLNKTIGAVIFRWIGYFPDCGLRTKPEDIVDGNVTHHLALHARYMRFLKTMYKLPAVTEVQIHVPKSLYPGYEYYAPSCYTRKKSGHTFCSLPPEIAYIAHMRKGDTPLFGSKYREECMRLKRTSKL